MSEPDDGNFAASHQFVHKPRRVGLQTISKLLLRQQDGVMKFVVLGHPVQLAEVSTTCLEGERQVLMSLSAARKRRPI